MSKHTPGPWAYSADFSEYGSIHTDFSLDADDVEIIVGCGCCGSLTISREANARLIAAAPELLEALKHCYDLLGRYEINRIDGDEIADEAMSIICSVITKATGEVLPW